MFIEDSLLKLNIENIVFCKCVSINNPTIIPIPATNGDTIKDLINAKGVAILAAGTIIVDGAIINKKLKKIFNINFITN